MGIAKDDLVARLDPADEGPAARLCHIRFHDRSRIARAHHGGAKWRRQGG